VKTQISETFLCAGFDAVRLKSVMMRNHGNKRVVNLLEQLAEISKAQLMPGIIPEIMIN